MSAAIDQLLGAGAEELRNRALAADRSGAEWLALAKAGARVGKRMPDRLIAEVRAMSSSGELRQELLRRIGAAPTDASLPEAYVRSAEELLLEQAERIGEYLTDLTQAAVSSAAEQRGRAAALREAAAVLDGLAVGVCAATPPCAPQSQEEAAASSERPLGDFEEVPSVWAGPR